MKLKASQKEAITGYAFLMPNLAGFLIFTSLPVIFSLVLSFVQWDMLTPAKFIGFGNFTKLLGFHFTSGQITANDPFFWKCAYNTVFLMIIIPIEIMCALGLAVAMNQKVKGIAFYRTLYFLPTITNGVAICILWTWIYNYDFGLLNTFVANIGKLIGWLINNPGFVLRGPQWLTSTAWAKPSLMIMGLWVMMGGYNMILFLAALQGIPRDLYEAAEIDGATGWQKFWAITWPMISPTTFFIAIMAVIGGFQGGFMQAYIMTGGGPEGSTTTLEYLIYSHLYSWQNAGYAASIAWVVFIIVFFVTIFNWRFGGKMVHY